MDDVLLEVRRIREAYAKEFGYDLLAIHRDLKEQEQASGRQVVSMPPRRPRPAATNGAGGQVGHPENPVKSSVAKAGD